MRAEIVDALLTWLEGCSLAELYLAHPLVDRRKRALLAIQAKVHEHCPVLDNAFGSRLQHKHGDIYHLLFADREREAKVLFYGKEVLPRLTLTWGGSSMGRGNLEPARIPAVLRAWFHERATPTEIGRRHSMIEISTAAVHHERGQPIEGDFIASWDRIEDFYGHRNAPRHALAFVRALRAEGFDTTLRAGQSLWSFVLSRARRHGLARDDPSVMVDFGREWIRVRPRHLAGFELDAPGPLPNAEIIELLRRLERCPIR